MAKKRKVLYGVILIYLADQLTKAAAVKFLENREYIFGPLTLTLVRNPGAAFSTLTQYTWALTLASAIALTLLIIYHHQIISNLPTLVCASACAGTAGNLTDRLLRYPSTFNGHVIDFISIYTFPIFNLADLALTAAFMGYVLTLRNYDKKKEISV